MKENEQKINQIKQRILQFIDLKNISKREFCKKIGINPSHLGNSNLKSDFSGDILSKILLNYSEVNIEWLILGKGEMLKDADAIPQCSEPPVLYKTEDNIKDKYIEVLEENRELHNELKTLLKSSSGNIKKQNNCDPVCQM